MSKQVWVCTIQTDRQRDNSKGVYCHTVFNTHALCCYHFARIVDFPEPGPPTRSKGAVVLSLSTWFFIASKHCNIKLSIYNRTQPGGTCRTSHVNWYKLIILLSQCLKIFFYEPIGAAQSIDNKIRCTLKFYCACTLDFVTKKHSRYENTNLAFWKVMNTGNSPHHFSH